MKVSRAHEEGGRFGARSRCLEETARMHGCLRNQSKGEKQQAGRALARLGGSSTKYSKLLITCHGRHLVPDEAVSGARLDRICRYSASPRFLAGLDL